MAYTVVDPLMRKLSLLNTGFEVKGERNRTKVGIRRSTDFAKIIQPVSRKLTKNNNHLLREVGSQ